MEAYMDKAWQRSMKLRLDINGMMADFVGEHGLSMADIEKNSAQYKRAAESMAAKRANMKWRELPHNQAPPLLPSWIYRNTSAKWVREW